MTIGKLLKLSLIWDKGLSSSKCLEVVIEQIQVNFLNIFQVDIII